MCVSEVLPFLHSSTIEKSLVLERPEPLNHKVTCPGLLPGALSFVVCCSSAGTFLGLQRSRVFLFHLPHALDHESWPTALKRCSRIKLRSSWHPTPWREPKSCSSCYLFFMVRFKTSVWAHSPELVRPCQTPVLNKAPIYLWILND